jgi:N,N-dimethylformamidase beta subunit-like, C-terminal/Concanavalin A-like lectin/glucanases superfamily
MKLVGYADRMSVQPGESIRFMVSTEEPQYRAEMARLIHCDPNPKGPGFKEQLIGTPVSGTYAGQKKELEIGSYVAVPHSPLLDLTESLTLQAWIYPTTPQKGVQGILTKWCSRDRAGYALLIDEDGSLALWIGDGNGQVQKVQTETELESSRWYFVSGSYDASAGRLNVYQEAARTWPYGHTKAAASKSAADISIAQTEMLFAMGAYCEFKQGPEYIMGGHFNGKIESPRVFRKALNKAEIAATKQGNITAELAGSTAGAWDFSLMISSSQVLDTSPNLLHGVATNMPARAMTGHNWEHNETNFRRAPAEYGAIYFHDDDLEDARWKVDFEFRIPLDMKTGVYAASLQAGDADYYIPFFVRPKRGTATSRIAYLIPILTYLAYANMQCGIPGLLSLYDYHSDGSGVCYASRLRPLLDMNPKQFTFFTTTGDVYPRHLCADLYFVDWMEAKGYEYDIITDEDLHYEGAELLAPYKVVVTGSHPEYCSGQMLDGLASYLNAGGRLMYLGGNGFYWVTTIGQERPHAIEVRRWGGTENWKAEPGEYFHSTTGELGGIWRHRGRFPQELVGVGFSAQGWAVDPPPRCGENRPYARQPGSFHSRSSFIFEGVDREALIGNHASLGLGTGPAGDELDRMDYDLGTPRHALLLATASNFSEAYLRVIEEIGVAQPFDKNDPLVRSDMAYFEYPNGGAVFSVGSISWFGCLSHNNYNNPVSQITNNVLKRFASDKPLPADPSE